MLDHGWLCVLCGRAWDPARYGGVELPEELLENAPLPTQTDCTRVRSLLITVTAIGALGNWMEGKNEDDEDNLIHDMQRLGCQGTFDMLFHQTLTRLHELEPNESSDEEEPLTRLPCWGTAYNPDVRLADMNEGEGVDVDGSDDEDMEETLY